MANYGNQHITEISRVQLPEIAQDPEFGVRLCATPLPVVASETETGRLYNDKKGVFVKKSEANDTITFTLEKDGVDLTPLGDFIGLPYDPLVVAFVIDWRQHLINHGSGCYKLRVNFDIAGVTGEYYEGTFELFPYGNHTVENTVRLYSYFDSYHSAKGVNFKDSGFHSSIRFGGRFGNRQPNTEINNIKHTDNIQRKIRRENINTYELITDPLSECFTHDIIDFHLVGENEIFITDNAAMNHSYRYRDYPVILSDTPEFDHTSGRPSSITATFEDKQLKEYTSFVSSQDPNVVPAPTCDPATVENSDQSYTDTVASGGTLVVPDSEITINTNEVTENVPATISKNFNALDQNGDPLTVSGVSGDNVSFDVVPYRPFIFTVKTDNAGVTANNQYKIPVNSFTGYYYDVETSDGQFFTKQTGALTITFPSAGTYDIKIKYGYIRPGFYNSDDQDKIIDIKQFGDVVFNTIDSNYRLSRSLTNVTANDTPIIVDDLARSVFRDCSNLISINNINNWDIVNVEQMDLFFAFCGNFSADLSNWNIVNISDFSNFALGCTFTTPDYDATLIGWEATLQAEYPGGAGYPHTISIDFGSSQYTAGGAADTARASLISNFGWTIADGGSV